MKRLVLACLLSLPVASIAASLLAARPGTLATLGELASANTEQAQSQTPWIPRQMDESIARSAIYFKVGMLLKTRDFAALNALETR